jgi:hypothetical protein
MNPADPENQSGHPGKWGELFRSDYVNARPMYPWLTTSSMTPE